MILQCIKRHNGQTYIFVHNRSLLPALLLPHLAGNLFIPIISVLAVKPPFVVHLAAVVSAVQVMKYSRNGVEMLDFRLLDMAGNYVECRAHGRHARNPLIEDKNELVVYGATVNVPQRENQTNFMWLFNEAHVVLLRRNCPVPQALRLILYEEDE